VIMIQRKERALNSKFLSKFDLFTFLGSDLVTICSYFSSNYVYDKDYNN